MNKRVWIAVAACSLASGILAEEVQFSDTPKAVQNTVNRNLNGGVVKTIDKKAKDGRTVYDVAIRREGTDKQLRVDADGKLMAADSSAAVNITTDKNDGKLLGVLPAPSHDDKTVKGEANVGDKKVKIEGNVDTKNDLDLNKNHNANAETKFKVEDYGSKVTVDTDSDKHKIIHKGDGKLLGFIPWKKHEKKMEVEVKTSDNSVGAPPSSSSGTK